MIYKSTPEEVKAYFLNTALNQSDLKLLRGGLANYKKVKASRTPGPENEYDEIKSLKIGSAVDMLLQPGGKEDYELTYHIAGSDKTPSETVGKMLRQIFDHASQRLEQAAFGMPDVIVKDEIQKLLLTDVEDLVLNACNDAEYYMNRTNESRMKEICKADYYFEALKEAYGKTVLSQEEHNTIKSIVSSFKSNVRTKDYFDESLFKDNPNLDIYFQKIIYFKYRGYDCKAMLDILVVDKSSKDRVIIVPVDIKTTFDTTLNFISPVKAYRYDIQGAWYTLALQNSSLVKELLVAKRDYLINKFKFLVETTSIGNQGSPLVFTASKKLMQIGLKGRAPIVDMDGDQVRPGIMGIEQLMVEYEFQVQNGWKEDRIVAENPVNIPLDWDFDKSIY